MLLPGHSLETPSADLREALQNSLGDAFAIERQLGGGGMSRVFVAREVALDRLVVVKVLPPEFAAAVNLERFRREIQLAAQLQHPHIVPVHTSGETNGIPFFTMPFIEGESLRGLLSRGERLSVHDVVRILLDVSDALAYAHEQGVVHRDIKPDNILLTRGHAVVTDFGVAKALTAANSTTSSGEHVTGVGIAIGTPAYMAPEQAAGDPNADHRADIYGLGVLAYELLAGRTPFGGRSPQDLMRAHMTEAPESIAAVRFDLPPALASLVMRSLAKRPSERPESAAAISAELQAMMTPVAGIRRGLIPRRSHRTVVGGLAAAAALLAAVLGVAWWPRRVPVNENIVAVAPFRLNASDPALRYLREGMLDLLSAKLTGEGGPRSADPRTLLSAWRRAAGSDTSDLSRDQALGVAERVGAGMLLLGDVAGNADHVVLNASLLRVRDGRAQAQVTVEGDADSLPQLVDLLAAKLLASGAGENERLGALTSTSLPALRAYLAGQSAYRRARFHEAAREYDRALQADSTFALAALGLVTATGWYGDPALAERGTALAWAFRERLSVRDRAMLESRTGPDYPRLPSMRERYDATARYVQLAPDRADAWFELGDGLFHFGPALGMPQAHERSAEAFRRTLALDSAFSPALEHLLFLEARAGDTAAVRRVGRLYLALDSASENADGVRWRMAAFLGDSATLRGLRGRMATLSPISTHTIKLISQSDVVDLRFADTLLVGSAERERLPQRRLLLLRDVHDLALNRGQPARAKVASERWQALSPAPRAALRERIRDALFWDGDQAFAAVAARELIPVADGAMPEETPARVGFLVDVCTVELWRQASGNMSTARRAIDLLRTAARNPAYSTEATNTFSLCAPMLDLNLATAERSPGVAAHAAELDSILAEGPGTVLHYPATLTVARALERQGDVRGALTAVRRQEFYWGRPVYMAPLLREEGRLAERAGDLEGALSAYRRYAAMRADAEPILADDVADARAAVARLEQASVGR